MNFRSRNARWLGTICLLGVGAVPAAAQVETIQRIAGMVAIAADEYGKAFDSKGRLVSVEEYQEAVGFLGEARRSAIRLPSERRGAAAILDSMITAVDSKGPVAEVKGFAGRFALALGSAAALDLPKFPLNPDSGARIYAATCANCHGARAMGDGPLAPTMNPRPPAIGSAGFMYSVAPSMMFQKVSVGVSGTAMPAYADRLSPAERWNVVAYLTELRHRNIDKAHGEGSYAQNCASCHGMAGRGDGALARELSKLPPAVGTFAWQVQRADSEIAMVIRNGVPGSPMPAMRTMTPAEEQEIVAYLRSIAVRQNHSANPADTNDASAAATRSINFLEQSLSAARAGRTDDASDRATDAYIAFEPVETRSRPKNPGLVLAMEQTFGRFKAAVRTGNIRSAEQEQARIEGSMPSVLELTRPTGTGLEAFWQSFLIILREGFEAILVIGAVVTFLLKTGHRERLRSIWVGVIGALVASAVTAVVLKTILSSIPASREIIEGVTMLVAVAVLFSVSYWLISRVEAAKWQQFIRDKVTVALDHGGGRALAVVAFLAVYREGAETALFYQALINDTTNNVLLPIFLGIITGFAVLAVVFTLFYKYGVRIPLRPFFGVTSVLLYYMAFVFMGKGIKELQEGNAVPATFIRFPTVDWLGIYPTWQTLTAQLALLILFAFAVLKTFWPKRSVSLPTVQPVTPELEHLLARIESLEKRISS